MPYREVVYRNNSIYHVFNKTIESKKIFLSHTNVNRFIDTAWYYRSSKSRISFSNFQILDLPLKRSLQKQLLYTKYFRVRILAYCLMPTHFHFLLEQKDDNGIVKFLSQVLNSFTKCFNTKNHRLGPIFLPRFKAVLIHQDNQFLHVSRYIHLNPYSSGIIKTKEQIITHPYSSMHEYMKHQPYRNLVDTKKILSFFDYDKEKYKNFVLNNAEHQKMLEACKHSLNWVK